MTKHIANTYIYGVPNGASNFIVAGDDGNGWVDYWGAFKTAEEAHAYIPTVQDEYTTFWIFDEQNNCIVS